MVDFSGQIWQKNIVRFMWRKAKPKMLSMEEKTSGAQTHNKKCSKKHSKRRSDPDFCNRGQGRRNCAF